MENIQGRVAERNLLDEILKSGEPELVAIYGRRRVGKTFLVRNQYNRQLIFEFSGIHNASLAQQLENFTQSLSTASGLPLQQPATWLQALTILQKYLEPKIKKHRKVIFFDEFPWINTPRSGFLQAFENFWNTWASVQKNLVVVICGSAAAWMIQHVVNNRGGLYNRVTQKIRLLPFNLAETAAFLKERRINLDHYQVIQLYMAMGGIPQYLHEVKIGESATQAIDRICFTKDGFLNEEFKNLFHSLFDNGVIHMDVIRALAKKSSGLTRNEIIAACKISSGGGASQILGELTESGFVTSYVPFDRTARDTIFKLTDEYAHFYLKFIENSKFSGIGSWARFSTGSSWKSWSGSVFENVCMKHVRQIKRALGIEAVHTEHSVWRYRQKEETGAQIDLLIDRQDLCINVCEMKFLIDQFELTKSYTKELEAKLNIFRNSTKTRKTLFLTLITSHGISNEKKYPGLIQSSLTMGALFT